MTEDPPLVPCCTKCNGALSIAQVSVSVDEPIMHLKLKCNSCDTEPSVIIRDVKIESPRI